MDHGTTTIKGRGTFKVANSDFMISPLENDTELYINSIVNGVVNPVSCGNIIAGEYTKVHGAVPFTEFYVDTNETFYVKW